MKVMIGAGQVVHEGVPLKVKSYWGERARPLCGVKGNTGGIIRAGCWQVEDTAVVTCKKCLAALAQIERDKAKRAVELAKERGE